MKYCFFSLARPQNHDNVARPSRQERPFWNRGRWTIETAGHARRRASRTHAPSRIIASTDVGQKRNST